MDRARHARGVVEVCCLWQQAVTAQPGNSLPVCADIVLEQSSVRVLSMVLPRLLADSLRWSLLQGRELPGWHGDARAYKQQLRLRRAWHGAVLKQRCRRSCTDCRMCPLPRGHCRWRMLQDPGCRQTRVQLWKCWPFCGCSSKVPACVGSKLQNATDTFELLLFSKSPADWPFEHPPYPIGLCSRLCAFVRLTRLAFPRLNRGTAPQ